MTRVSDLELQLRWAENDAQTQRRRADKLQDVIDRLWLSGYSRKLPKWFSDQVSISARSASASARVARQTQG